MSGDAFAALMASLDAAFSYRPSDSAGAEDEVESDLDGKIGVFSEDREGIF